MGTLYLVDEVVMDHLSSKVVIDLVVFVEEGIVNTVVVEIVDVVVVVEMVVVVVVVVLEEHLVMLVVLFLN